MSAVRHLGENLDARDEHGQVLVLFAVALVVLLLITAFVIDPSNAFVSKQTLQNRADATALGAAADLTEQETETITNAYVGERVNHWSAANGGPKSMTNCPDSGRITTSCYRWPYQGDQNKIEIYLVGTATNFFGSIFGIASFREHARAVAGAGNGPPPPYTFLSLNHSCDNHTLKIESSGHLTVDNNIYTDSENGNPNPPCKSTGHDAFDVFNSSAFNNCTGVQCGGYIAAPGIFVAGGWESHAGEGSVVVGNEPCVLPGGEKEYNSNNNAYPGKGEIPSSAANPPPKGCPWIDQPQVRNPFAGKVPAPKQGSPACAGKTTYPSSSYSPKEYLLGSITSTQTTITVVAASNTIAAGDLIQVGGEDMKVTGVTPLSGGQEQVSVERGELGTKSEAQTEAEPYAVTTKAQNGATATLTTSKANGIANTDGIYVSGVGAPFDGVSQAENPKSSSEVQYNDGGNATIPPFIAVIGAKIESNVATITTSVPHGFTAGETVFVGKVGGPIPDGQYAITNVPSSTTFQFSRTGPNQTITPGAAATVGYVVAKAEASGGVWTITTSARNGLKPGYVVYINGIGGLPNAGYAVVSTPSETKFTITAGGTPGPLNNAYAWGTSIGGTVTGPLIEVKKVTPTTPGTAATPTPCTIPAGTTGTQTLSPGTYYGGICIGLPAGTPCNGANCEKDFTASAYSPVQTLSSAISATQTTIKVSGTAIQTGDTIQVGNSGGPGGSERVIVTGRTVEGGSESLTVVRAYMGSTASAANAGTEILHVQPKEGPVYVTFSPGVYVVAGGGLYMCGGASISAPNVMIYNTVDAANTSGSGALGQVELYSTGNATLGPQTTGRYSGLTIFQDPKQELEAAKCDNRAEQKTDIVLRASANGLNGISGTIYAAQESALFADEISGTANLAVLTGCILINGATSTFDFKPSGLFGVGATLGE
jgi:hypothetical protein